MQGAVVDALAKDIDHAALANLAREPGEELEAVDVLGFGAERELAEGVVLGGAQEGEELRCVEGVGTVVVLWAAGVVAGAGAGV